MNKKVGNTFKISQKSERIYERWVSTPGSITKLDTTSDVVAKMENKNEDKMRTKL